MVRTQISLRESQKELLDKESERTGRSISDLIRESIDRRFGGSLSTEEALEALSLSAGAWKGRSAEDDVDGKTYVERLRSGRRLRY
jgi:predicted DNA-binding protein